MTCSGPVAAATLSHFPDPMFHDGMEGPTSGPFNDGDAARFLAQATFGPTDADITDLRTRGYQGWLDWQMDAVQTPPSSQLTYYTWVSKSIASGGLGENTGYDNIVEAWFLGALGGPDPQFPANPAMNHTDQLRQRVAFALSEIFVISDQNTLIDQHPDGQGYFYDIVSNNAFGNYRTLLEQVTLSPAMGVYLNIQGNPRANLSQNLHPDENYAREVNQLFSIGLVMLNADGTPQLDAFGKPIPTYDQAAITTFAHVFTGWNWADCTTAGFKSCGYHGLDFQLPMVAPSPYTYHDNGTDLTNDIVCKQLLNYPTATNSGACGGAGAKGTLSSGGTPASDLAFALDNIFNHPNVGVFIGKQLIQRLVTSNPSPEYVQRITNVFNDDGFGTRGNLGAVVKAILLDPEARYGQFMDPEVFGKLREPLLRITHFWRAMGARHQCGGAGYVNGDYANAPYRYAGYDLAYGTNDTIYGNGVGQAPIKADTVFNFFKPGYVPGGEMAAAGLLGPEFQINTDTLISNSTNAIFSFYAAGFDVSDAPACSGYGPPGEVAIDRSADMAFLTANGNGALIDRYNKLFMSGQMSPFMRQTLLTYLNSLGGSSKQRINALLMLILSSPEYMIQK
ncbi:MAG TPA: DUF1800 family protein [Rudaea sp.]